MKIVSSNAVIVVDQSLANSEVLAQIIEALATQDLGESEVFTEGGDFNYEDCEDGDFYDLEDYEYFDEVEEIREHVEQGLPIQVANGAYGFVDRSLLEPDHRGIQYFGVVYFNGELRQVAWDEDFNPLHHPEFDIVGCAQLEDL